VLAAARTLDGRPERAINKWRVSLRSATSPAAVS
jgi:hypothetical protein